MPTPVQAEINKITYSLKKVPKEDPPKWIIYVRSKNAEGKYQTSPYEEFTNHEAAKAELARLKKKKQKGRFYDMLPLK